MSKKSLIYDTTVNRYRLVDADVGYESWYDSYKTDYVDESYDEDYVAVLEALEFYLEEDLNRMYSVSVEDWEIFDEDEYELELAHEGLFSTIMDWIKRNWNKLSAKIKSLWNKIFGKKKELEKVKKAKADAKSNAPKPKPGEAPKQLPPPAAVKQLEIKEAQLKNELGALEKQLQQAIKQEKIAMRSQAKISNYQNNKIADFKQTMAGRDKKNMIAANRTAVANSKTQRLRAQIAAKQKEYADAAAKAGK